jgi:hypothetical protein
MPSRKAEASEDVKVIATMTAALIQATVKTGTTGDHRNFALDFEIDHGSGPTSLALIGDRSFGLRFAGQRLGEGVTVTVSSTRRDSENVPRSKIHVVVPEFGGTDGMSQIDSFAPQAVLMVTTGGLLEFTELQMAFDLTSRADD